MTDEKCEIDYEAIDKAMLEEMASWEGSKRPARFWDETSGGGKAARRDLAKAVLRAANVIVNASDVPGLMDLVSSAASESATVRVLIEEEGEPPIEYERRPPYD